MIPIILEFLYVACAFYALTLLLGVGLTRLLMDDDESEVLHFAPWIGIAQTGFILITGGWLGFGTKRTCWIAIAASLLLLGFSALKKRMDIQILFIRGKQWLFSLAVVLMTVALMFPLFVRGKKLAGFTAGNMDIYDYAMCARHLQDHGFAEFVKPFGQQPDWKDATMSDRALAWQIPAPRWLSYNYLSFLGTTLHRDPAEIFTLYISFLYALFIPILWLLAKNIFKLNRAGLAAGFALTILNPHIYYIVYNTFLPQIAATGFFIAFLTRFHGYINSDKLTVGRSLLCSLLAAGALACYLEIFSFLLFIATLYPAWLFWQRADRRTLLLKKYLLMLSIIFLLCPFQSARFFEIVFWHAGAKGGGWPMTDRYYLTAYPLGIFAWQVRAMNPILWMELILGPVLIYLIYRSLKEHPARSYLIIIIIPFAIAGAIAFYNDWNYRYYKNFTYLYFWLPLAAGCIICGLKSEKNRRIFASALAIMAIFISARLAQSAFFSAKYAQSIPIELRTLENLNAEVSEPAIYMTGMSAWEQLWAAYYLHDKNLVMPALNEYLRNEIGTLSDPRFSLLLTKDKFDTLLDLRRNRPVLSKIWQDGNYVIYQLGKPQSRIAPTVTLSSGFWPVESDSNEEWVWAGAESELKLLCSESTGAMSVTFDMLTLRDRVVELYLNGKPVGNLRTSANVRTQFVVKLKLPKGQSKLTLTAEGGGDAVNSDPRELYMRIFKIRLKNG